VSTELSTQLAILRQRLEESQATHHWKPEPGETLLGVLRGLKPAKARSVKATCSSSRPKTGHCGVCG
jgi:hypothetical protein